MKEPLFLVCAVILPSDEFIVKVVSFPSTVEIVGDVPFKFIVPSREILSEIKSPLALIVPSTSNAFVGLLCPIPIPTLASWKINLLSA